MQALIDFFLTIDISKSVSKQVNILSKFVCNNYWLDLCKEILNFSYSILSESFIKWITLGFFDKNGCNFPVYFASYSTTLTIFAKGTAVVAEICFVTQTSLLLGY